MSTPSGTDDSLSSWLRKHAFAASLIVFFCSASVRLFMASRVDAVEVVDLYSDPGTYLAPAQSLIEQGAFLDSSGNPMVNRTPGYPAFLALIMILASRDLHVVLIVQAVILSLSVLALYWLARLILPQVAAFMGAMLAAFSPWGAVLAVIPMSDGTF